MPKPHSRARPCLGCGSSGKLRHVEAAGSAVFVDGIRLARRPGLAGALPG